MSRKEVSPEWAQGVGWPGLTPLPALLSPFFFHRAPGTGTRGEMLVGSSESEGCP